MGTNSGKAQNIKGKRTSKVFDSTILGLTSRNARRLEKKRIAKEGRSNG